MYLTTRNCEMCRKSAILLLDSFFSRALSTVASRRSVLWLCLAATMVVLFCGTATRLALAAEDTPQQWALLIGCERYQKASPLQYTINDVRQLSTTLQERGGYDASHILQITDDGDGAGMQPLRASLLERLPEFLEQPGANDQIIVYFSGHGFRDEDGKMYLAPVDCDPANPVETAIAVEWFRDQLASCRADFKLLIIDSCHAGSEKGELDDDLVSAKDLGEPFRALGDVITLASSTGDEKSQIWGEKQQSLYSYWLNQALKGHADSDGDNRVDVDELNKYVHRNVVRTAKRHFSRAQTPVRIVRTGVQGAPVVMELEPLGLKQILSDMAEELTWAVQDQELERVAVLEFTNDTALGELLGADFGLLGRYCSEEIERRLIDEGVKVVDRRRLQRALSQQQFTLDSLGSPTALGQLSEAVSGLPVLALGTLRNRSGRVVSLQCKLIETETGDLAASAGGVAWLNEHEWAMLGRSARVDNKIPPLPGGAPSIDDDPVEEEIDETALVVDQLDDAAQESHPLADPNCPYRLRVMVDGRERKGVFRGNDYLLPLSRGETFEIWVYNTSGQKVGMRLLVDGRNTLPQAEVLKGVSTMITAPRVNLADARCWVLDPTKATVNAVRGFVVATGEQGSLREFLVSDLDRSLAARQQFTDQIGMITAAFYLPASGSRGDLMIRPGEERAERIKEVGFDVGRLVATINIRYVDAQTLRAAAGS